VAVSTLWLIAAVSEGATLSPFDSVSSSVAESTTSILSVSRVESPSSESVASSAESVSSSSAPVSFSSSEVSVPNTLAFSVSSVAVSLDVSETGVVVEHPYPVRSAISSMEDNAFRGESDGVRYLLPIQSMSFRIDFKIFLLLIVQEHR